MVGLVSANGLIALLDEDDSELQAQSLRQLNSLVDQFWPEIADKIAELEGLHEDPKFPERDLAALIVSKVYYYLGEYNESKDFALLAGKAFDISQKNEYVQTIISNCIDSYIEQSSAREDGSLATKIDPRLQDIVERMFDRCFNDSEYRQAVGIALECRRLDCVEKAISASKDDSLKTYILNVSMKLVQNMHFRNKVLTLCLDSFLQNANPDYFSATKCIVHLNDHGTAAKLLNDLLASQNDKDLLKALQIAFDFESSASQEFLAKVSESLPSAPPVDGAPENGEEKPGQSSELDKVRRILAGDETIKIHLEFLSQNNHCDHYILNKTKDSLEARSSIFHSAVTFANAFMNAGTTSDTFFRSNLEWLSKATNWSKFAATAALGVIHKGNLSQGANLLGPYLPKDNVSRSVYSEGGSLYALGLIHANHGSSIVGFLTEHLHNHEDETIQHGACLGLGVAGMASGSEAIYEDMKNVLFSDKAVAGEAAGLAMGLTMLGTGSEKAIEEMLTYAHETQHDKIVRGLTIGIALLMYAKEESADSVINTMCEEGDPFLRYGGMFTIGLAYAGTGNNKAIKRLLHFGVSDVNDDVRRAAVIGLGFVMFRDPKAVPSIVELLVESYNPHVRYGACMALGIACAGTSLPDALDLLQSLAKDNTDFVRQGAMIATAMILIQHNDQSNPRVGEARKQFEKSISEKHEDAVAKFGASLAQGIIDAGGRNVTIGLQSSSGSSNMAAIVGMTMFTQYWYWFPLTHFLSLSFTPTGFLGLNKDLRAPKFEFNSNARPSLFAYPPPSKPPSDKKVEKVETAVLSTTAKAQARAKRTEQEKEAKEKHDAVMEDDANAEGETDTDVKKEDKEKPLIDVDQEPGKAKPPSEQKTEEPKSESLPNFCRVVPNQLKYISMKRDSRYWPVTKASTGINMLYDSRPDENQDLIDFRPQEQPSIDESNEAPVPEDFEYPFDDAEAPDEKPAQDQIMQDLEH